LTLEKGNFILIDYTARIKETGKIFDTTLQEVADKESMKGKEKYEPKLIVIGENWIIKAIDDNLAQLEPDKPLTIEVPPEKAFGPRDVNKIRVIPLMDFIKKGIRPKKGIMIQFSGQTAFIRNIESGRVTIDLNHILAGKTLVYEITLKKKLETPQEKLLALITRRIPKIEESKYITSIESNSIVIHMPQDALGMEGIQNVKRGLSVDIEKFFPEVTSVVFIDIFEINMSKIPKKEEPKKPIQLTETIKSEDKVEVKK
jgi:peptidylprolyl isomerase